MQAAAAVATAAKVATPISVGIEGGAVGAVNIANAAQGTVEAAKITSETAGALGQIEQIAPEAIKATQNLEQIGSTIKALPKEVANTQFEKQMGDFVAKTSIEKGAGGNVLTELKDATSVGGGEATVEDAPASTDVSSLKATPENSSVLQPGAPTGEKDKNQPQQKAIESEEIKQFEEMIDIEIEKALLVKTEINQKIEIAMFDWDENHPIPSDKKEYGKYVTERVKAEKDITVSARVDNEMQAWMKENPKAGEKDIATQKQILEKKHSKGYDREVRDGQKEHDGMSAAEFAKKVEELKTYRANEARMIQAIAKNDTVKNRTPETNAQRQLLEDMRNQYSAQADALQAMLETDAASSKSGWKKMILPTLMVGMVLAGPAMQAANDEGSNK